MIFVFIQGKARQHKGWFTAENPVERTKEDWSQIICNSQHSKLQQILKFLILVLMKAFFKILTFHYSFQDSLDAEWQEINNVFSEVMRVVEDAWKKALRPLEERYKCVSWGGYWGNDGRFYFLC